MNYINQRNYNDLINWLMNYCLDHGIGVVLTNELPDDVGGKSYIIPADLVVVNNRWLPTAEIPFIFAHEIGHIKTGIPCSYHSSINNMDKGEADANRFAINLFIEYCKENDFIFSSRLTFAESFFIPSKLYYLMPNSTENWIIA
ncbi:ImmA/IrrE family metallo-endopeptidase [Lactobacillus johnsonii]|uniref:ImmA/IrrE family metallo-endopeptidase n=1 Tax=Lactobacillus johnsonii TaxID=33959 RepID=A0A9X6RVT5_LACJH|nr:hypothetical protein [Lactobacillus johnsonii]OYS01757.1 hypothetical protein CBF54_08295 [Lactobacillus johnsonii]OYS07071.1 hypothetical protein CBF65_07860 [Lactobacillus johnsonii]OYS07730.1 hypothetical protein CBF62_04925 [Lactobacillus johnsonii]OYS10429.1 hypothetical protein CBF50_08970 [Lactobacillus johnsonii]OYS11194.1 hypothetical protein CBF63_01140 [Lactobacillus johnsonii]